jgi:hypothetical protein
LAPSVLDHTVSDQAHEANFIEVMHAHMLQNFPHGPLFDEREILHRQIGRAMGQDGNEITEVLQFLNRADVTPALILLPDAFTNLLVANLINHQVFSEGIL